MSGPARRKRRKQPPREGLPSTVKAPLWIYNSNELAYDLLPASVGQLSKEGENSDLRTEPELGTIIF